MSKSKYKNLIENLGLDETYTKATEKVIFDHVKQNIPPLSDYNFMADLISLPTTKEGYRYLLTMVDLWSDDFDCRALKTKTPEEVLKATKDIFKSGKYLKKPYASLATDGGKEFAGVFKKYLYDESIYHKISIPGRHKQQGSIEALNNLLDRFLIGYMNKKEEETGRRYREWTDILDELKKEMNRIRHKPDEDPYNYEYAKPTDKTPKYKIGDLVIYKLDEPKDALGHTQSGKFRTGDLRWNVKEPRRIKKVLYYPNNIRYCLEHTPNVSYTEAELKPAKEEEQDEKFIVRKILNKRTIKKKVQYLVWFKGDLKKDAIWIAKEQLIEDGLEDVLKEFDQNKK